MTLVLYLQLACGSSRGRRDCRDPKVTLELWYDCHTVANPFGDLRGVGGKLEGQVNGQETAKEVDQTSKASGPVIRFRSCFVRMA